MDFHHAALATDYSGTPELLQSKTIAVDPGHGGYGPSTTWRDIDEKDINLAISKKLTNRLKGHGAKVILTRNGDFNYAIKGLRGRDAKRYDLNQRIKLIESHKAEILIAIHVNSVRKTSYEGAEAFYHPKSRKVKNLLWLSNKNLEPFRGLKKECLKSVIATMLRKTKMPAVLVEVGFLSNPHERKLLQNPKYLDTLADKIANGVVNYYNAPEGVMGQGFWQEITRYLFYEMGAKAII